MPIAPLPIELAVWCKLGVTMNTDVPDSYLFVYRAVAVDEELMSMKEKVHKFSTAFQMPGFDTTSFGKQQNGHANGHANGHSNGHA